MWPFSRAPKERIEPDPPAVLSNAEAGAETEPAARVRRRRYEAARPDRFNTFSSVGFATSGPEEVRRDLRGLISHSRKAAQNYDYVAGFEAMARRNIVGPSGVKLQMDVKDAGGTSDDRANKLIETAWEKWRKKENCSVCGRLRFRDIEDIAVTATMRDGQLLLQKYRGRSWGPFGFQLQPKSIDFLDTDYQAELPDGHYIDGGIEFDAVDRVQAYHLFTAHPGGRRGASRRRVRVPASDIIHLYRPTEPGQFLGLPQSRTALRRMSMLNSFERSALIAANFGARNVAVLKKILEDDAPAPSDGESNAETAADDPFEYQAEEGVLAKLEEGWELDTFDPKYPDDALAPFVQHMLRGAAAGLGVSYHGLANDLTGANFSSLHYGANEERDEWRGWQTWLFESLHEPLFGEWLPLAIMTGQINLPMQKVEKFRAATWRPRGWRAVNPKDQASADAVNIGNGLESPFAVASARGQDLEQNIADMARAQALAEKHNVQLDFLAIGKAAAGASPDPKTAGET